MIELALKIYGAIRFLAKWHVVTAVEIGWKLIGFWEVLGGVQGFAGLMLAMSSTVAGISAWVLFRF